MNVVVYCGAHSGKNYDYTKCAKDIAKWIIKKEYDLVYGAGKNGLMGIVANEVLDGNRKVIGVMPRFLEEIEIAHQGLSELIFVDTMSERKFKMFELGDIFIALPGGAGTLEEISEVISWARLGKNDAPCIFINENGFYDDMKRMYERMAKDGFITEEAKEKIIFASDIDEIDGMIKNYTPPSIVVAERR